MCVGERVGDLDRDRECAFQFERPSGDKLADVFALDVLHRDVKNAVRLVKIVDRADVRVVELGAELGFAFESFEVCGLLQ